MSQLQQAGLRLDELILVPATGEELSLINVIKDVELVEDINQSVMYGMLTIIENNNYVEALPIVGEELLRIQFSSLNDPEGPTIKLQFRINKVENLSKPKDKTFQYSLGFISEEYYDMIQLSVDRAMTDNPDKMVATLIRKDIGSDKKLYTEDTKRKQHIVFPSMSVGQSIKYCGFRAESLEDNDSNYKFFETARGFNFCSVGKLCKAEPVMSIEYGLSTVERIGKQSKIPHNAFGYTVLEKSNTSKNTYNGGYRNSVLCFDPLLKKYQYKEKNYFEDDKFLAKVEAKQTNRKRFNEVVAKDGALEYAFITNLRDKPRANSKDDSDKLPEAYGDFYLNRQMSRVHIDDTTLGISMPLTTRIAAGDVVRFNIPKDNSTPDAENNDRYLAGKYLVTKVRYLLGPEKGIVDLVVRKSGYSNPIERAT